MWFDALVLVRFAAVCYLRVLFDAKALRSRALRSVSKQDVSPNKELLGSGDRNGGSHPFLPWNRTVARVKALLKQRKDVPIHPE